MSRTEGAGERSDRRPKLGMPRVPSVGAVTGASRRQQYSAATRKALVKAAEQLFTVRGYAATSLESIVTDAKVTKGALYHHFSGKQGIFEAVFTDVEDRATKAIQKAVKGAQDPWEQAVSGLRAFIDVVQQPAYRRVVVQEGPAVLGHERFREQEERSTFGLVHDVVDGLFPKDLPGVDADLVETFSRILFGALSAAGDTVADSDDPAITSRVESALLLLLGGVRNLLESQVPTLSADQPAT